MAAKSSILKSRSKKNNSSINVNFLRLIKIIRQFTESSSLPRSDNIGLCTIATNEPLRPFRNVGSYVQYRIHRNRCTIRAVEVRSGSHGNIRQYYVPH